MSALAEITDPVIAININRTYSPTLSSQELYEFTRGIWRLNRIRADQAKYAFAVYQGEIKEVYEIKKWLSAGSTPYEFRIHSEAQTKGRFEFLGNLAEDMIRHRYLGKFLPEKHVQNPIKYFNCKRPSE